VLVEHLTRQFARATGKRFFTAIMLLQHVPDPQTGAHNQRRSWQNDDNRIHCKRMPVFVTDLLL
jgi:hypothetical protein